MLSPKPHRYPLNFRRRETVSHPENIICSGNSGPGLRLADKKDNKTMQLKLVRGREPPKPSTALRPEPGQRHRPEPFPRV